MTTIIGDVANRAIKRTHSDLVSLSLLSPNAALTAETISDKTEAGQATLSLHLITAATQKRSLVSAASPN